MNVELFKQEAVEVINAINSLSLVDVEGECFIRGNIPVMDGEGTLWHTYQVEVYPSEQYPYAFPAVFETGGAIPRIPDWHINVDNTCCLDNEFSQQIKCFTGLSLLDFVNKELVPWLANQSYRRLTGNYINGEQGHGDIGRIEFFIQELNAPNLQTCVRWMIRLAKKENYPRQAECFCGSGKKWRNCHKAIFEKLAPISQSALFWAIDKFATYLKGGIPILAEIQRQTKVKIY